MFFFGMVLPEYREGDSVWPGRPVLDVIEAGRMELRAKIDESDRDQPGRGADGRRLGRHAAGADVQGQGRGALRHLRAAAASSSRPRACRGCSTSRSSSRRLILSSRPAPRRGCSSRARRSATRCTCRDRRSSRRTARTMCSCATADRFEPREVKVVQRTESRIAIDGVAEGARDRAGRSRMPRRSRPRPPSSSPLPAGGGK